MIHKKISALILYVICLFAVADNASAKDVFEYGIGVGYGNYSVDDPDGDTGRTAAPSLSGVLIYTMSQQWRLWSDLSYATFDLPYEQGKIGQSVKSLHIDALFQRGFELPKYIDAWLGAGVGLGLNKMTDRSTVDSDGFLDTRLEDRDETNFSFIANAGLVFGNKNIKYALNGKYYVPLDNGLDALTLSFFLVFNFD